MHIAILAGLCTGLFFLFIGQLFKINSECVLIDSVDDLVKDEKNGRK